MEQENIFDEKVVIPIFKTKIEEKRISKADVPIHFEQKGDSLICEKCLELQKTHPDIIVASFSDIITLKVMKDEKVVTIGGKKAMIEAYKTHLACFHPI